MTHKVDLAKRASKRNLLDQLRGSDSEAQPEAKETDIHGGSRDSPLEDGSFGLPSGGGKGGASTESPRPPEQRAAGKPSPRKTVVKARASGPSKLGLKGDDSRGASKGSAESALGAMQHHAAIVDKDVAATSWNEAISKGTASHSGESLGLHGETHGKEDLQRELERQLALGLTTVDREFRRQADALDASLQRNRASRRARHEAKDRLKAY